MIILDTNVVSEMMRPRPNVGVVEWLAMHAKDLAITSVLVAEVGFGIVRIHPSQRSPRLRNNFDQLCNEYADRCHTFDLPSAVIYGEIMGNAALAGRPIQVPDGMIAAIALRHSAELATRNVRDFEVLGVKVVNPWE